MMMSAIVGIYTQVPHPEYPPLNYVYGMWQINSLGVWDHFMSYTKVNLGWGIEDARKVLGIDTWAIVRADGIVIACSRLTEAQTRALYAVIGRAEPEAA